MTELIEKKVDDIKKEADEIKCPVRQALYYVDEFLAGPMCGKCFPCEMGAYEARIRLNRIVSGKGKEDDLSALVRIADEMADISRCKKGKDTAKFIREWIDSETFRKHLEGICPDKECGALIEYRVIPEKCTICGLCQEVCRDNAIVGEKMVSYRSGYLPFEIRQKRCTKCGECIKVCPSEAIEVVLVNQPEEAGVGS